MNGRHLLHYRVLERIGEGGMGEVYLAEDTRLGRRVVLKTLPADLALDAGQLEREARALAALNHPNILTVHAVEEGGDGRVLVTELVEGRALPDLIPDHGLDLETFVDLGEQLADGIAAAHRAGVTHRDLKPGNVMVTVDGRIKILDFGLAERQDDRPNPYESTATQVSAVSGTVPYMSPELLEGLPLGPPADVFSLGVVLYRMATGQRPFGGVGLRQTMLAILGEEPPVPSSINPRMPPAIDELIAHCLRKEPRDRPSAAKVGAQLRLAGDQRATGSPRARWLAAAAIVGVLAVVLTFGLREPDPGPEAPVVSPANAERAMIVVLPFENLGRAEDEYFAAGITEEITSRLAAVKDLGVISRTSAVRYGGGIKSVEEIGSELGVDYILEGTVRWSQEGDGRSRVRVTPQLIRVADDTHLWAERYDRVLEDLFEVQTEIASQVLRQLDVTLFPGEGSALVDDRPTQSIAAYQAYLRGTAFAREMSYSVATGEQALAHFARAIELDPGFASAHAEASQVHSRLYHFGLDRTDERRELARIAAEKALELAPESAEAHLAKGNYFYWTRRDYDAALAELAEAERWAPSDGRVLESLAYVLRRRGRLAEARENLLRAAAIDPLNGEIQRELAGTSMFLRRYRDANRHYDRAIALLTDPVFAYLSKVRNQWLQGDVDGARATLDAMPANDDPLSVWYLFWQLAYEDRPEEALRLLEASGVQEMQWTIRAFPTSLLAAQAHRFMGDEARARAAFADAVEKLEKSLVERPEDARLHGSLGLALAGLGEHDAAIAAGRRSADLLPVSRDALFGAFRLVELAVIYAWVDEHDLAFDGLDELLGMPSQISVGRIEIDPVWDPLRDHPRYRALLANHHNKRRLGTP